MPNRILDIYESHRNFTVTTLQKFGFDQPTRRIIVTNHLLNVPNNRNAWDLIVTPTHTNGLLKCQHGIRVFIINLNHRYEAIRELRNDPNPGYDWIPDPFSVFLSLRSNGPALRAMDIMKNRKVLNIASSTFL